MDFGFTKLLRTVVCGVQLRSYFMQPGWQRSRGPGHSDPMQHLLLYKMMG